MKIILSDGTIIKGLTTNSTVKFLTTIYTVTFKDWDASVLKTETLDPGIDATPPSNPSRTNYTFNGWSPAYTNVQGNLIITAQYIAHYLVRFKDWDGAILKSIEFFVNQPPGKRPIVKYLRKINNTEKD